MNNHAPYGYLQYNHANAVVSPSTVHVANTGLSWFFKRQLFLRILSVFKWTVPKHWASNYFLDCLYGWGYVAVFNTNAYGVIPQGCELTGFNVFYQPTRAIIENPALPGLRPLDIGRDCVLIKLSPDYGGVYDIVSYYADQLALAAQALGVNLVNSKMAYVFAASNKAAAESLKKLYDQITAGNPAVFYDSKLNGVDGQSPWQFFQQNLGSNLITGDLLEDMRTIISMFDTEVGIPNVAYEKKERLITGEVNGNNVETYSKVALWMDTLQEGIDQCNQWWNLGLKVEWRFTPVISSGGGVYDGPAVNNGDGKDVS